MLKGIDPLLTADLLHALASMGHGDELAIVDANFPAVAVGRRVLQIPGADAPAVLAAVLTVFPLDTPAETSAFTMAVAGNPHAVPAPAADFAAVMTANELADAEIDTLERDAFYERARHAFVIVRTGELRPYGNILLAKGVVNRYNPTDAR